MKKQLLILTTALLSLSGFAQIPNYVPTNGLVAYYPFNGNADDESGNGNNGTVIGATLTSDRFGVVNKAYSLDGVSNYIDLGNPSTLGNNPSSYTQAGWGFFVDFSDAFVFMSKRHDNSGNDWATPVAGTNGKFIFFADDAFYQNAPLAQSNALNVNQWYHLVFVKSLNDYSIYVDGVLIDNITDSHLMGGSNNNLIIGAQLAWPEYFKGKIDDIGIWNRALTACEIQDLYASQLNSTFVSAGIDESICNGDQVTLTATGSQNYSWNNGVVDGSPFSPTNTLEYIVTADSAGCQSADTLTVFINQPTNSTLNETALDSFTLNGQTYNQSGTYTQVIPNAAGCDSTITLNLSLDFTGLLELDNSFTISPNPAKDQLNVLSPSGISENYFLLDAQGRKVLAGKLTGTATTIDISKLAAGNYLVQVGEEQIPVRIVKN